MKIGNMNRVASVERHEQGAGGWTTVGLAPDSVGRTGGYREAICGRDTHTSYMG